ncbi:hypothetical protein [Fibrella aquatilis]|uniref:T9SS type A sorting domain-containing protein n=1 Tax=Fibrella aquatilis TaxID=2817059 RepID=A0A939G6C4_9BACT|nr:hypothetical protein [Fibrella aquatilis]MBO0933222.1 hypothetical protein [Fibrella aquatilis]
MKLVRFILAFVAHLVLGALFLCPPAVAQVDKPQLTVNLTYNAEAKRYEVYAQSNFTQERFLLGPSQISIVVPGQMPDQSLNVVSATAHWTDYSNVYAPAVAPLTDFHGIHSMGKNIDVQRDTPFMLFAFSLPAGYVDGVRLYLNDQDPGSVKKGMMGGDFNNTLSNHRGAELFQRGTTQADLDQLVMAEAKPGAPAISVYPNPATGDAVSLTVRHFEADERLTVRLLSASGVELYKLENSADQLVNYQLPVPRQLVSLVYLQVERAAGKTGPRTLGQKLLLVR